MSKQTRLFVSIAAGIVMVGLGTGLVAAYKTGFQNLSVFGAADGPAELAYVVKDARMVGYADIHALVTSDIRQKFHPSAPNSNPLDERTGVNFERDVDHVLAFASASEAADMPPLVLARGRFDVVRIEGAVREEGGIPDTYRGVRVISNPERHFSLGFLEPDLIAFGSLDDIHHAIDTKASGDNVRNNADVMRFVRDIDTSTAWAVAQFDASMLNGRLPGDIAKQLPALKWIAVNSHVDDGVRGTIRAETRDEAAAKDLTDVVRGFMALARLQGSQNSNLSPIINSLQLSEHGSTVTLDFAVPRDAIDALPMLHKPGANPGQPAAQQPAPPRPNAPAAPNAPPPL